jgi:MFS family permease
MLNRANRTINAEQRKLGAVRAKNEAHLRLLAVSHGMNHAYQLLTPVVIPEITREYGITNAGILSLCFVLSYSLLPVLSGYLSQTFGRRNLLTLGFAVSALAFLAIGFVSDFTALALLFFIAGAGGSTYHPNGFPILAETYPASRGQTLGLHQTGGAIGAFVGPLLTGIAVANFTWRPAMMLLAVPGLVLATVLWFSISPEQPLERSGEQPARKMGISNLKTYGPAILFIAAAFIYALGQRGTDVFANEYFVIGRGIEIAEASFLFSMLKVAGLFSAPVCGKLSDAYGRKKVLVTLIIVESVSLYAVTTTPDVLVVIPCIVFGFAAFGLLAVGEALLADVTPENQRATIFGISLTVNFSSTIILTPALFTLAQVYNFSLGFVLLSLIMPLSIPIVAKIKAESARKNSA